MFENRCSKKCFGVLGSYLNFCEGCAMRTLCMIETSRLGVDKVGLCAICSESRTIGEEWVCIREEQDEDGDMIRKNVPLDKMVLNCDDFEHSWKYGTDDDPNEDDEEYDKFLTKMFGPSGEIYKEEKST